MSCDIRDGALFHFFRHENCPYFNQKFYFLYLIYKSAIDLCLDAGKENLFDIMDSQEKNLYEILSKELPSCDSVSEVYDFLLQKGFRRSGDRFYFTECGHCRECVPIRLKTQNFKMTKSQRAVLNRNKDIIIRYNYNPKEFATEEKALIYKKFCEHLNPGLELSIESGSTELMDICSGYEENRVCNMEYYLGDKLIACGVLDIGVVKAEKDSAVTEKKLHSLSSNYFYYDVSPEILKRSPGVFSVLKEIEFCKEKGIEDYYLGLYLPDCENMNYKCNYRPYQLYINDRWIEFDKKGISMKEIDDFSGKLELETFRPVVSTKFPTSKMRADEEYCKVSSRITIKDLYSAYMKGAFPWYSEERGNPVVWCCPPERFIITPESFHVPTSGLKVLKKQKYTYTKDKCFEQVIKECQKVERYGQRGTWINNQIVREYTLLHKAGFAHSYEAWNGDKLAGGFYGIQMGNVFCGESMFTLEPDSSKTAFIKFATEFFANGGKFIDCQAYTDNMARYGAHNIPRKTFLKLLRDATKKPGKSELNDEEKK